MQAIENHWLNHDSAWRAEMTSPEVEVEHCVVCSDTGMIPETCLCGNDDIEPGLRLCPTCGRIVEYVKCPDCKGRN